jgi:TolA-binding protein
MAQARSVSLLLSLIYCFCMNKLRILLALFILAILLICAGAAVGQQSAIYHDFDSDYKKGLELFQKEKYAAAQKMFEKQVSRYSGQVSEIKINSEYYNAICAAELFHKNAEDLLVGFLDKYPESNKAGSVRFYLGNFQHRRKKYKEAIKWYELVDAYDLSSDELAEYYYKLGYSYFEQDRFNDASRMFFEIKDIDTKYSIPANYYFSHIAYLDNKLETAFNGFVKLEQDANFGPVVPFYIAQIYFLQGKYDDVVRYAPPLLNAESNVKRSNEIAKLVGESYFKLNNYHKAIPYLEIYRKSVGVISREDAYQLGFSYYMKGEENQAIEYFQSLVRQEDSLAQNAFYVMGAAYMRVNNKNFARSAFRSASKLDFDKQIKEDALFNYAKLSYELSNNPFQEAIEAFHNYIKEFPNTERTDDAYKYLLNVFLTTKNYKEAITAIESIGKKTKDLEYAYQKVSYYRGIDLYNIRNFSAAVAHFEKAITYPLDKNITAQAYYWKAEALFNQRKYDDAIGTYKTFLFEPGAAAQEEYFTANYNLGYAYFKKKDYPVAISWFRKYVGISPIEDNKKHNDALLRIADSYFISKDYENASDYYDRAAKIQMLQTDYALFQKALCLGLLGKHQAKIPVLETIIQKFSNSYYAIDAKFETGNTYFAIGDNANAITFYNKLIKDHPNSSLVSKAYIRLGLINFNSNEDEKALSYYKKVISEFPGTPESHEALSGVRNILVAAGRAEEYSQLVSSLSFANVSKASLDSTYYESAEGFYMKGDCNTAIHNFENYIEKFPEGIFMLHANFYLGECYLKNKELDKALKAYQLITDKPTNLFSEKSLVKTSSIQYSQKKYEQAKDSYLKLEKIAEFSSNLLDARIGVMRSSYHNNQLELAKDYAEKLFFMENVTQQVINEANLIIGKYSLQSNQPSVALSKFKMVKESAKDELGAEASYHVAYIRYAQEQYKDSEKAIFEMSDRFSAYDYWVAKAFILLADNYIALNDNFQAKHTLQSIIDNYEGDELKKIAQQKLDKIIEQENEVKQKAQQEQIEIRMNTDPAHDKLFEEPKKEENEE